VKRSLLALLAALVIAGCSRVNEENFLKIRDGMKEEEVIAILGQPTESNSVTILGISGTAARWVTRDAAISVRFVNGQVALKSFERPGGAEAPK
jgi:Prokaryotic membrane lipoprotein lipid attachment site